jgi:hypothetical protein
VKPTKATTLNRRTREPTKAITGKLKAIPATNEIAQI